MASVPAPARPGAPGLHRRDLGKGQHGPPARSPSARSAADRQGTARSMATTTFLAALRLDGMTAPMVLNGPIDGEWFLAYVEQVLCPTLRTGDFVIIDNLGSHKSDNIRLAIEACGASLIYLPPYSPDLNPIENAFAKLKARLRRAAKRSTEALWNFIGEIVHTFSPQECANYFKAAGYAPP
jgi:transposase